MKTDTIIVLDFGGQYAHLIANRIRRLHVYSEIVTPAAALEQVQPAAGIILSGGPASVYDRQRPAFNPEIFSVPVPILGLCYGHQLMAQHYQGTVKPGRVKEYGLAQLTVCKGTEIFEQLGPRETVWMSHGDSVAQLPPGFEIYGSTTDCPVAAMGDPVRKRFGLQFHPEVTHTVSGMKILLNFINCCQCRRDWTMEQFVTDCTRQIREQVGGRRVFLFVSGGVDSTVAFTLLNNTLGVDRVYGLHVDTGMMRQAESRLVMEFMAAQGFHNLQVTDASEQFLAALSGITDPEEKRRIIGETFIAVQEQQVARLRLDPDQWLLGQGTIYPDTIETGGTEHADRIKTHHNRIEVIQQLIAQNKVVEPLRQLYKDEVREVATRLGIPHKLIWRHPFPGPGLGVRALCIDGKEKIAQEVEIGIKLSHMLLKSGFQGMILPIRSVGVQGDSRTYAHPVALWGPRDWDALETVSTQITNTISQVNRAVYCLHPAGCVNTVVQPAFMTRQRLDLLRQADWLVMSILEKHGQLDAVWQFPVVLVPISQQGDRESIVLRPLLSQDAMTASFAKLPWGLIEEVVERLAALPGIDCIFYDITHKPPGTIEWE